MNVLHVAFTRADPKSVAFQLRRQHLFTHLGSARGKAAHKMLVKSTLNSQNYWFNKSTGSVVDPIKLFSFFSFLVLS